MLDDFLVRALIAGVLVAMVAGPFGCFVIWRKMAYFGDTMAHSALLGVTLSLLLEVHPGVGVFIIASLIALLLVTLQRFAALPGDTILGILSHSTLALGLIAIGLMSGNRIDLMSYLFGDVLAVSRDDVQMMLIAAPLALLALTLIWRPLLAGTVNEELAQAESQNPKIAQTIYLLLLAGVIAIAIRIVGILLITALLVIPAAAARRWAVNPETMALIASVIGIVAVACGLSASLLADVAAGPAIVVSALLFFLLTVVLPRR
jgi:zinc transport system permease protein